MQMLQKKNYTTPTTRFASITEIVDAARPLSIPKFRNKKQPQNKSRKLFYNITQATVTNTFGVNRAGVVTNFVYNKKPYQLMLNVMSMYKTPLIFPGVEYLNPGRIVFDFTTNHAVSRIFYLGSQIILDLLPYHLFVSSINNYYNNKKTFARSSGTFGVKLKAKKTVKLIMVKLPSSVTYFFLKTTKCFIGKNHNFFNNKFIEGKWGFGIHKTKTIHVRGVAMNPVDHPNGGRTKAKQPEKSPWG